MNSIQKITEKKYRRKVKVCNFFFYSNDILPYRDTIEERETVKIQSIDDDKKSSES